MTTQTNHILITGGTGLIGQKLTRHFAAAGASVSHLGRHKKNNTTIPSYVWDIDQQVMESDALLGKNVIVHLSGSNAGEKRWTAARKKDIIDSRVKSTELLVREILRLEKKPDVVITASAIGWYGLQTSDEIFTEDAPASDDFFGTCCRLWEEALQPLRDAGIRVVTWRIGVVLAREGGALPKMAGPVRWLAGSTLGSGKQWMPWIHIDDLVSLFDAAATNSQLHGVYNAVTSTHINQKTFVRAVGKALHRPILLPAVPGFILKLMLGEMANLVLTGSRVSNAKILATGFRFRYEALAGALENLLKKENI